MSNHQSKPQTVLDFVAPEPRRPAPVLLPPVYDGNADTLLDTLLEIAREMLRTRQDVVESDRKAA